ncbi:bifunctional 3-oxoadipate enol-lactonase/4-carboxymuconolactone decarboxylase PcaDC [Streptomyces pacificus]|uniref:4-carboxymuconolactone decarboxylase n=1 Tax=Streptomyces pacificus TaxID=2705029 RepID=A0A6A0AZK6_9ACTN|nr:4-carboxymuconolactone decarboxylase [Streptomyces pacificus]GFH37404.1 4-carboxymuconolactone decarboxylase [Streptomyces pacificus]
MSETPPNTLQYRFDGPEEAPVLILGPSLGTTWHMWDRQVPELSRRWRVLRFDLPGHGGAPAHPAGSVPELADRLVATLDELGIERFGYAGCSVGGAVGIVLALRIPHRVASLALVAASPRFGTADEFRRRSVIVRTSGLDPMARAAPESWFTPGFAAAQPAIVEWAVQMVRTTDPGCYIAACEALAAFDVRADLGRLGVPTLVLVGSDDQLTGPAEARTLVAGIPDARLALVPGASHLAPVEQPAAVTDLLVRHFSLAWQETLHAPPAPQFAPAGPSAPSAPQVPSVPQAPSAPAPPTPCTASSAPASSTVSSAAAGPSAPSAAAASPASSVPSDPCASGPVAPVAETAPAAEQPHPEGALRPDPYEAGMEVRRAVLGDAHVDRAMAGADEFTADFQELVTRYAWGEVWTREGLDRRTRSAVALTALAAGGHLEELASHTRAALRNGLTPTEIREILIQTGVYCGTPAANAAFRVARSVILEETTPRD